MNMINTIIKYIKKYLGINKHEHIKKWYAELFDLEQLNQDDYIKKLKNWKYNITTAKVLYRLKDESYQIISNRCLNNRDHKVHKPVKYIYKYINNCDVLIRPDSKDSNIVIIEVESPVYVNDGPIIKSCDVVTVDKLTTYKDILLVIYKNIQVVMEQKIRALELADSAE